MRTILLIGLCLCSFIPSVTFGQTVYFEQNFTTPGPYVSATPSVRQFTEIGSTGSVRVRFPLPPDTTYLEYDKSGTEGFGWVVRSEDFSPVPNGVYFQVSVNVNDSYVTNNENAANFFIGQGFDDNSSRPNDNNVFAGISIGSVVGNAFYFRDQQSGLNSAVFTEMTQLTMVLNNRLTDTLNYVAPDGGRYTLDAQEYDIWVNNSLFLKDRKRISNNVVALTNFSFLLENGPVKIQLTDFLIREVAGILPVQFASFRAQPIGTQVELAWETAWEQNADRFVVQRSSDLKEFGDIADVKARGTTSARSSYTFTDPNPTAGVNYYRLRQVDTDGTYRYSAVVEAVVQPHLPQMLVSPNPVQPDLIRLRTFRLNPAGIQLVNLLGQPIPFSLRELANEVVELRPAVKLAPGLYLVTAQQDGLRLSERFMVR